MTEKNYATFTKETMKLAGKITTNIKDLQLNKYYMFILHVEDGKPESTEIVVTDPASGGGLMTVFPQPDMMSMKYQEVHFQYLLTPNKSHLIYENVCTAVLECINEAQSRAKDKPFVCYSVSFLGSEIDPAGVESFLDDNFERLSGSKHSIKIVYDEDTKTIVIYNV